MWIAYARDGEIFKEGKDKWIDVRDKDIKKLECTFAGEHEIIEIPKGCIPILFNTGEIGLNTNKVKKISQSIGYAQNGKEHYVRIRFDGVKTFETGDNIH